MSAPRIQRLSRDLINKIAAGEVVERPASVIKELVENAIDAESSRIEVTLEEGGRKLIRVLDDGVGMSPEDLAVAFESHTTSKLTDADGLFDIQTLGFRGEALASIASVSHCRCLTRQRGAPEGALIEIDGGRASEVRAAGVPEGTLIEVRDLFFNTPARLKFLRTTATELRHAVEMVTRLALPHPAVAFQLLHNGRSVLKLDSCESFHERLDGLFGSALSGALLPVRSETSAMTLTGFISPPGEGETTSLQYVFLNGRYIRDRAIARAVTEAYRSRLMRGRFPAIFLAIQMDSARVDVNVHPTKVEVRFRDSGAVFAQVLSAIETTLRGAGPTAAQPPPEPGERRENVRKAIMDFFEGRVAQGQQPPPPAPSESILKPMPAPARTPSFLKDAPPEPSAAPSPANIETGQFPPVPAPPPASTTDEAPATPAVTTGAFFQIHDSYIIEQRPDGFVVIDQHALHERILYEELRRRSREGAVPRQRLLVPEIVDLRAQEFVRVMELKETLLTMGLEVEAFGERTIAVQAVPHMATKVHPRELLLDLLQDAAQQIAGRPADSEERLMRTIACKAAVKAGERLSRAQIEALLDRRNRLGPEPTCPHGRPTTLRFTLPELEKQFRRT